MDMGRGRVPVAIFQLKYETRFGGENFGLHGV